MKVVPENEKKKFSRKQKFLNFFKTKREIETENLE